MENYRKYIEKVLSRDIAKYLLPFIEINKYAIIKQKRNSFYNGEYINVGHIALLNIGSNADSINEIKLLEIKKLCDIFKEKEFFFISDWLRENDIDGFSLRYDADIMWENFSKSIRHFENYFHSNLPGNWWVGENWCRYISEAMSDSYSTFYEQVFDIPHELIIVKENNFIELLLLYEKYGTFNRILQHKEFLDRILESQFKYLLADNVYISGNSIDYIKSQIF